jgi:hypothetical protein
MVVPVAGGEVRRLLEGEAATSLQWVSNTELLAVDLDGYRLKQLNREGSSAQTRSIPRCVLAQWVPEQKQLLCSYNRTALLFDPESGKQWSLRAALPDGSPGSPLTGSAFRIVNNRYLVYLAVDGSLLAARYDPATHVALRSVTLLAGVRREAIGEAQYDPRRMAHCSTHPARTRRSAGWSAFGLEERRSRCRWKRQTSSATT